MAEIVNLTRVRKRQARAAKEERAAANRVRFGAAKVERKLAKAQIEKDAKSLDALRLDSGKPLTE